MANHWKRHCPEDHRLLCQVVDKVTKEEAILWLCRCFGPEKAENAVLVPGCYRPPRPYDRRGEGVNWPHHNYGFMVFIPKEKHAAI